MMNEARIWNVYRQDDNGNRFLVKSFVSEAAARQCAAELESHGHKQLYWVTSTDSDDVSTDSRDD